jgi:thiosulfate reductase cytochrome b subunit
MSSRELHHPLILRIAHWLLALSVLILIGSGWRIYDASPIFSFRFPVWATLGGDVDTALAWHNDPGVATAIAWHLAAIWLFFTAILLLIGHGALSGHFRRDWLPLTPRAFFTDFFAAARFRLAHDLSRYNAVQKAFYWGVLFAVCMMLLSGLAIWKPVQLAWLTALFGGFQGARLVHFLFMSALALFIVVHLTLVVLVPSTLLAMVLGHVPHRRPQ